jgi:amino acid transporter
MKSDYQKNSITLMGAISMGTGVMIGAGIFALTGQIAELAGRWFPLSFVAGAVVTGFSAYSYIKMSNAFPSAGGIAMILQKAYGPGAIAAAASLLMALSMVINESLVARTFGTYVLRPFDLDADDYLVPLLAVGLIIFAYIVNIAGNRSVGVFSFVMALLKIGGIVLFGIAALWAGGMTVEAAPKVTEPFPIAGFMASVALSILAFKGFTTITNGGAEIVSPHQNVGRAIMVSIAICVVVYLIVAFAVGSSLSIEEIVVAKDYALAEAAVPTLGTYGFYFTVGLAALATASGLLASVFAVSRMLAMLTDMKMIPHSHFGMSGKIQEHTLVYTIVTAAALAVFFDLSRIASLGVFFYLVMDILVHVGVYHGLREQIGANGAVLMTAVALDTIVLGVFGTMKLQSDPFIVAVAIVAIVTVFAYERFYLSRWIGQGGDDGDHSSHDSHE